MQHTIQRPATESGTFTIGGDLKVYRFGFGTMRLTGPGIWGPPADKQEALAVLHHALDLGMNLLDTADSYGPEVAESLIAEALYPYPKDLVIATKGGLLRTGPNQWPQGGRPEHLRKALEGSLRRLRLDRIDIYQFHRPDPKVPFEDSVGALAKMLGASVCWPFIRTSPQETSFGRDDQAFWIGVERSGNERLGHLWSVRISGI